MAYLDSDANGDNGHSWWRLPIVHGWTLSTFHRQSRMQSPVYKAWVVPSQSPRLCSTSLSTTVDTAGEVKVKEENGVSTEVNDTVPSSNTTLLQGDFCGYLASFDIVPTNNAGSVAYQAQIRPLPDYAIPPAMLEWGQVPTSWEYITSEDMDAIDDDDNRDRHDNATITLTSAHAYCLTRHGIRIYPALGCAVDNLDTQKDPPLRIPLSQLQWYTHRDTIGSTLRSLYYPVTTHQYVLEVTFAGTLGMEQVNTPASHDSNHKNDTLQTENVDLYHRIRIQVPIQWFQHNAVSDTNKWTLVTQVSSSSIPIHMWWERQTATTSSHGTAAHGGGLDGARIRTWMGSMLHKQAEFAVSSITSNRRDPDEGVNEHVMLPLHVRITRNTDNDSTVFTIARWVNSLQEWVGVRFVCSHSSDVNATRIEMTTL
jgi:hypothetical protein